MHLLSPTYKFWGSLKGSKDVYMSGMFMLSQGLDKSMMVSSHELGGSRMERKSSLWKNFLLLTIGSLFALHMNVSKAADNTSSGSSTQTTSSSSTDDCVLEAE